MNKIYGFETDTVWGIGCDIKDEKAVEKIYEIKGRNKNKPLILMSDKLDNLLKYVKNVPDEAFLVMKKYFPGALTVILEKSELCPDYIFKNTIAIRIPNHKDFWELAKRVPNKVLATTSLNFSEEKPCANYEEAIEKFGKVCEIIKPAKTSAKPQNTASTIIDFTQKPFKILRQGSIKID